MTLTETIGERLLLTLWVGALWTVGYLCVPLAFASFEVIVAAEFAAKLFLAVHLIGLVSGALLLIGKLVLQRIRVIYSWRFWLLTGMWMIVLIFISYLLPEMSQIKTIDDWRQDQTLTGQFDFLHTLSQNLYLMLSIGGLLLVMSSEGVYKGKVNHGQK